ncbi:hypothetical protein HYALB_00011875 [Hymenoscyphus albidus]|uniref:Rhodopsin domain-containing protein n=1 Tax=Hymenoscyphus albidus TaxID=595503 RepID=A0A9N9LM85_9HELO|nr:hypothetical protein HYALB_00011875 [Hymenoscyphus albidus]
MSSIALGQPISPNEPLEHPGTKLVYVGIVFFPVEILFVALRAYSRSLHDKKVALDDILIWFALLMCLSLNALAIAMVKYGGVGRHWVDLERSGEYEKLEVWAKCLLATGWLYLAAVTLPKICVLVLYHRIFDMRRIRWSCYVLSVIMIANFFTGGMVGMFACRPLSYLWDHSIPGGKCINVNMFFLWIGSPNIITDFAVLILPLPIIWYFKSTKSQKFGLLLTFSTGSWLVPLLLPDFFLLLRLLTMRPNSGLVSSLIRFKNFSASDAISDGTMASAELMIWTIVEPGMCLIAACLLRFKPLLRKLIKGTTLERLPYQNSRAYYLSSPDQMKLSTLKSHSGSGFNTGSHNYERIDNSSPDEGMWNSGHANVEVEVSRTRSGSLIPPAYFSRPG